MAAKYFALLTDVGAAKLANMAALGEQLAITHMAVGDGGGNAPTPNQKQTTLVNEVRRAALNSLMVDADNTSQIIAEQIIPETAGGWWIREIGLFDADGNLIAVANCPDTYKATTDEGSGRTQVIRMVLVVSSTDAITLKIDPSVVLATRQYVDDAVIEVKGYADKLMSAHLADSDPHTQYLKAAEINNFIPVGIPLPWPQALPPNGWLKCNGAAFDVKKYPRLAVAYPSGYLPDLRGEFIRGWDDGRGVDGNRAIQSRQSDDLKAHAHTVQIAVNPADDPLRHSLGYGLTGGDKLAVKTNSTTTMYGNPQLVNSTGGSETRPRNIAFNYIVRAA